MTFCFYCFRQSARAVGVSSSLSHSISFCGDPPPRSPHGSRSLEGAGDRPGRSSRAEIAGISDRRSRSAVTLPSFLQIYESNTTRGWILELEEQLDSDQARTK